MNGRHPAHPPEVFVRDQGVLLKLTVAQTDGRLVPTVGGHRAGGNGPREDTDPAPSGTSRLRVMPYRKHLANKMWTESLPRPPSVAPISPRPKIGRRLMAGHALDFADS